ncbi:hypothetical protein EJB05_21340, partial [Eragrostis curvula]
NWIQATFRTTGLQVPNGQHDLRSCERKEDKLAADTFKKKSSSEEFDLSEDLCNMFVTSHNIDEVVPVRTNHRNQSKRSWFQKKIVHKRTPAHLQINWAKSAQFMCSLLAENLSIVAGKRLFELGCGSAGICSMVAASFAQFVVATDGDVESLDLLRQNISCNLEPDLLNKIAVRKLFWGNKDDVVAVRDLSGNDAGFNCIIGTDVTYNPDAILPLFKTARGLISDKANKDSEAALILCYIQRRVHEDSILSNAMAHGFKLVDKWINGIHESIGIISSWFYGNCSAFRRVQYCILKCKNLMFS